MQGFFCHVQMVTKTWKASSKFQKSFCLFKVGKQLQYYIDCDSKTYDSRNEVPAK